MTSASRAVETFFAAALICFSKSLGSFIFGTTWYSPPASLFLFAFFRSIWQLSPFRLSIHRAFRVTPLPGLFLALLGVLLWEFFLYPDPRWIWQAYLFPCGH